MLTHALLTAKQETRIAFGSTVFHVLRFVKKWSETNVKPKRTHHTYFLHEDINF